MELLKDMWGHEHPLFLKEGEGEDDSDGYPEGRSCEACQEPIFVGPYYDCSDCVFVLHKSCAELPQKMDHPVHPSHTLTLLTREVQEHRELKWIEDSSKEPILCDVCGDWINNKFIYSCSRCNFVMDIVCASLNERKIQHPSHQHPLFPLGQPISCKCNACGEEHADKGIFYHCRACPIFFIHKDCASLSGSINRSSHEHPLKLAYSLPSQFSYFGDRCDRCAKDIEIHWRYWVYCCVGCRYISHVNCGKPSKIELPSKRPSRKPPKTEPPFAGWGYKPIIRSRHSSLDDAVHLPVSDESVTLISYFLKYASLQGKNDGATSSRLHHFIHDQPLIPFCGEINEIESGSGGTVSHDASLQIKKDGATSSKLNHFSHDHPLILFDGEIHEIESGSRGKVSCSSYSRRDDDETLCEACVKPVLATTPFYRCEEQCNFFLHKCCAELPMEIKHPYHSTLPLILLPKCPEFFGLFICSGCDYFCNGFIYSCDNGRYCLDVTCAFLPKIVKHVAHPNHVLSLWYNNSKPYYFNDNRSKRCYACAHVAFGMDLIYSCDTCDFNLDIHCALLPQTIRHRYDKHPFILTFSPVKNHFDDYYCEICEKILNPKQLFYHCSCCDQSIHIECLHPFDRQSNIKFGGTLTVEKHPHSLTLVPAITDITKNKFNLDRVIMYGDKCTGCDNIFQSFKTHMRFAFKCIPCNFKLCYSCMRRN